MEPAIVTRASQPTPVGPANRARLRPKGISLTGLAIVAVAVLVLSVKNHSRFIATEPFSDWFPGFFAGLQDNVIYGVAILLSVMSVRARLPRRGVMRYVAAAGVIVVTVLAVEFAFSVYDAWVSGEPYVFIANTYKSPARNLLYFSSSIFSLSFIGRIITSAWLYLCAEADNVAAAEQCAIDAERMDRQAAEARLQVLEAQIEPHFLFNTLAHVKRLYETDHAAGARMLHNLSDYLAGALPQMRAASTLGRELDHISAYINIQQIRMGRRLVFGIDVPEALRAVELPPLMVLTLVENAIKHGLSSLPEGGRIDVRASVADGRLVIQVADTGRGFAKSSGGGTGLANTRARLASKYGPGASLSLALNQPRGVVATVAVPYEAATTASTPR